MSQISNNVEELETRLKQNDIRSVPGWENRHPVRAIAVPGARWWTTTWAIPLRGRQTVDTPDLKERKRIVLRVIWSRFEQLSYSNQYFSIILWVKEQTHNVGILNAWMYNENCVSSLTRSWISRRLARPETPVVTIGSSWDDIVEAFSDTGRENSWRWTTLYHDSLIGRKKGAWCYLRYKHLSAEQTHITQSPFMSHWSIYKCRNVAGRMKASMNVWAPVNHSSTGFPFRGKRYSKTRGFIMPYLSL